MQKRNHLDKTHTPPCGPTRLRWLDIAKGIAIILVITGHTVSSGSPLISMIFMFHMPLFFVLAGYTFKIKPMKTAVAVSAKRLLIPYFLLFFIWHGASWLRQPDAFSIEIIRDFALRLIFASGSPNASMGISAVGMAWFLMCLFVSRIILNFAMLLFQKYSIGRFLQAAAFAVLAIAGVILGDLLDIFLPFDLDIALVTVGFMWCGYIARESDFLEKWGLRWYVIVLAAFIYIIAFNCSYLELAMRKYGIVPLCVLGALGGTLLTCCLSMFIEKHIKILATFLSFMGRNSMLVYCFHCIDWFIPWQSLPALQGLPLQHAIASCARVTYAVLMTELVKSVQK